MPEILLLCISRRQVRRMKERHYPLERIAFSLRQAESSTAAMEFTRKMEMLEPAGFPG